MKKNKKHKEIKLPMEWNLMTEKYEPRLPLRKGPKVVEIKRNWWAFWYIIISLIIFGLEILYFTIKYFIH